MLIVEHDDIGKISNVMMTFAAGAADHLRSQGIQFLEVADPPAETFEILTEWFVSNGHLVKRLGLPGHIDKTVIVADDHDTATITGLPVPCSLSVDGAEPVQVEDGLIEFATAQPGAYEIALSAWPYLDRKLAVTAQ